MEKEFKHKDFGIIDFGNRYNGRSWTDPSIEINWLKFIASDKCILKEERKKIARQVLEQRKILDGQFNLPYKENLNA